MIFTYFVDHVTKNNSSLLKPEALEVLAMFGAKYTNENAFPLLKNKNNKKREKVTEEHL